MSGNTAFFDVSDFSSRIAKKGLASPNKFVVIFTNIPGARNSGDDETQLNLMCDQVSLAGRDVQAILDVQYGVRRQVVYNAHHTLHFLYLSCVLTKWMKKEY